ncbi:hypothetical protein EV10_0617 [Prochlorococcus marinus str. SS51]|uniref:Uncharacterized protein n=2 Tax=Prochlorococcaceae TaxID=2881426 RepID=Q7VAW8_PROMA|nr:Uncharacterized protein Pro_1335 [Prochlorococcus marinus subsp. marinus str. CCMP1375]KGG14259.1 hypothetical protein EV04_0111 [Prochlorococcus marinus str. LG]KGG24514.1 hypothetical protein EV09_0145 [Prochlorococcus marinus str. SS35]KGG33409.1 hypothetical protein EV10_0617 [Prochlorococcus marinus str. SS51]
MRLFANRKYVTSAFIFLGLFLLLEENYKADKLKPRSSSIIWEKVSYKENFPTHEEEIVWEPVDEEYFKKEYLVFDNQPRIMPQNIKEAQEFLLTMEPQEYDFSAPSYFNYSFPTNHQLDEGYWSHSIYTVSSFSGGEGENRGSGNQNYAYRIDYGIFQDVQISAFYSVADDPLYSLINKTKLIPNYWEVYGASFKSRLLEIQKWDVSLAGSLEAWNVRNGNAVNGNIFNNDQKEISEKNLIGSFSMPITRQINNNLDLNLILGSAFLPKSMGTSKDNFYGNNIYFGSGLSWKIRRDLYSTASILNTLGPGYNSFDSELTFSRVPIYNLGLDWHINPIIGIKTQVTNGFGLTPSTALLTIPSNNKPLYFTSIKYKPGSIDSPQKRFTSRQRYLSSGGLTVNTALIPPRGKMQIWANIDNKGNLFTSLGQSLSNAFQLEVVSFGSFEDVGKNKSNQFVDLYMNKNNYNTRIGGKFVFVSPLRNGSYWLGSRITFGRNQDNKQGYGFYELINTWEIDEAFAINFNPKIVWSGIGSLSSFGTSANIQLSNRWQLIPEFNLKLSKLADTNYTLALRRIINDHLDIDFYVSTSAGFQDIGQMTAVKNLRQGVKLSLQY